MDNQNDGVNYSAFPHSTQHSEIFPTTTSRPITTTPRPITATLFDEQFDTPFDLVPGEDNSIDDPTFTFMNQMEQAANQSGQPSPKLEMMWPNLPPGLPPPDLLRHLCVYPS